MLVISWIVVGGVMGAIAHLILRDRGYDLIGEMLLAISAAAVFGVLGPVLSGVRTGSVDILSDVGLFSTFLGAVLAMAALVYFTPRAQASGRSERT